MFKFHQQKSSVVEEPRGRFAHEFAQHTSGDEYVKIADSGTGTVNGENPAGGKQKLSQIRGLTPGYYGNSNQLDPPERKGFHWLEKHAILPLLLKSKHGSAHEDDIRNLGVRHATGWGKSTVGQDWMSPTVTAAMISLYLQRYTLHKNDEHLRKAIQMGRWLVAVQCVNGAFPYAYSIKDRDYLEPLYTFNAGIIINALLHLNTLHPMLMFQKAAVKTGDWLVKSMQCFDGSFKAGINSSGRVMNMPLGQHGDHGSQHLKLLQSFQTLTMMDSRLFRYKHAFAKLKRWALSIARCDGSFPMYPGCKSISTTSHLYALEGVFGCEKLRVVWDNGLDWMARTMLERNGWVPETIDGGQDFNISVGNTAQALRLLSMGLTLSPKDPSMYIEAAQLAHQNLEQAQCFTGKWPDNPKNSWWDGVEVLTTIHTISALLYWKNMPQNKKWFL